MKVSFSQITPSNFRCGDVLVGNDGNQYEVTDAEGGKAEIRKLPKDERNKPKFTQGKVRIK